MTASWQLRRLDDGVVIFRRRGYPEPIVWLEVWPDGLRPVFSSGERDASAGSAASVCRSFATGCCASTPADRTGWSMGSHRAHPRSSTPITAAHWRRLLRPARSRRSTASCARRSQGALIARGRLGDLFAIFAQMRRRTVGLSEPEGARLRTKISTRLVLGRPARCAKRAVPSRLLKKTRSPAGTGLKMLRARLPKVRRDRTAVVSKIGDRPHRPEESSSQRSSMGQTWHVNPRAPREPAHRQWALYLRRDLSRRSGESSPGWSCSSVRHRRHGGGTSSRSVLQAV